MVFQLHINRIKAVLLGLLLLTVAYIYMPGAVKAQSPPDSTVASATSASSAATITQQAAQGVTASAAMTFTSTDDATIQQRELSAYLTANELSTRVVQVDLEKVTKISQYTDIDSSAGGLGFNGCGLVAAAAAMGGTNWVPVVSEIATAAGNDYGKDTGIQPSNYVTALQKVFGTDNVAAENASSLGQIYQALQQGKIVIVDIKVNAITEFPSTAGPNYAHFARVLGIDASRQQIYIENTLGGASYWTLSLADFLRVWRLPETSASIVPAPQKAEPVTRWAVLLNKAPVTGGQNQTA